MRTNACLHVSLITLVGAALQLGCGATVQDEGADTASVQTAHQQSGMGGGVGKETICHVPPGNPENAHTITIGAPAVYAHLDNHPGDYKGPCKEKKECQLKCECKDGKEGSYSAAWADEEEEKCECECKEVCEGDGYSYVAAWEGKSKEEEKWDEEGSSGGVDKVTICHVPPGNPENAHTITIGEPAVYAHLDNHSGDYKGPCQKKQECKLECECKEQKEGDYSPAWADEEEEKQCGCECEKKCEYDD